MNESRTADTPQPGGALSRTGRQVEDLMVGDVRRGVGVCRSWLYVPGDRPRSRRPRRNSSEPGG